MLLFRLSEEFLHGAYPSLLSNEAGSVYILVQFLPWLSDLLNWGHRFQPLTYILAPGLRVVLIWTPNTSRPGADGFRTTPTEYLSELPKENHVVIFLPHDHPEPQDSH